MKNATCLRVRIQRAPRIIKDTSTGYLGALLLIQCQTTMDNERKGQKKPLVFDKVCPADKASHAGGVCENPAVNSG